MTFLARVSRVNIPSVTAGGESALPEGRIDTHVLALVNLPCLISMYSLRFYTKSI
jgi:hypothetical protein